MSGTISPLRRLSCGSPRLVALGIFGSLTKLKSAANDLPYTSQVALGLFGQRNAQASKVAMRSASSFGSFPHLCPLKRYQCWPGGQCPRIFSPISVWFSQTQNSVCAVSVDLVGDWITRSSLTSRLKIRQREQGYSDLWTRCTWAKVWSHGYLRDQDVWLDVVSAQFHRLLLLL